MDYEILFRYWDYNPICVNAFFFKLTNFLGGIMFQTVEHYFQLKKNGTTISKEVIAGLTTFMAMAYILAVQPSIMKDAGMPVEAVVVGTAIISAFATILMGIVSRYPFALAPGMGENILFTYVLVVSGAFTWQQGMTVILFSGSLFLFLTLFGLREKVAELLPAPLKLGIGAVVGIFLINLGMLGTGLSATEGLHGFTLGNLSEPKVLLSIGGFFLMSYLVIRGIHGGILIGIFAVTVIGLFIGVTRIPEQFVSLPPSIAPIAFQYDFSKIFSFETLPLFLVFFIGDFFGTLGTLIGVSSQGGYLDKDGNLPDINKPFMVDAIATVTGSMVGMTTVTTYVESAAGISAGGRTGLTSVITGLCFVVALFFTPIILMVPQAATAPVLLLVGFMLLDSLQHINFGRLDETLPPLSMLVFTIFTFNMTTGIAIGTLLYIFIKWAKHEARSISWGLYALGGVFLYYIITQIK